VPFKSKAQQKWMFSNMPKKAKEWAKETPDIKNLPERKSFSKSAKETLKINLKKK
jgi:hypothetical protein